MPDWRLTFFAPVFVTPGPTGIIGVTVTLPGPMVEARGKNRDWVLQQAATFLGAVTRGTEFKTQATLERYDEPIAGMDPGGGGRYRTTRDLVYVPGASVVFLHPLKGPLIFPVKA